MSSSGYDHNGVLREEWNDDTRLYTKWDAEGVQIEQRPYTADENAAADIELVVVTEAANKSTIETNLEQDLAKMQAIKDQTNAEIREDPSQEIKELAVAVRRLIKMSLEDFSEAE